MSEFEFVDELPAAVLSRAAQRAHAVEAFAVALRKSAGRWGKWPTPITGKTAQTYVSLINQGYKLGFARGDFEAAHRDGQLFVRYIGDDATGVTLGDEADHAADRARDEAVGL